MTATPAARAASDGLWDRIQAFSFDAGAAAFPFWSRLASENGWSLSFAARAISEYRRFVYLAVVAGHPVSPSDHVDQVWHLHLLYTESYWERLCRDTLGMPLHHHPTTGGGAEHAKFDDWYRRTLESYRRLFVEEPPADIWPRAEARAGDGHYQRVNTRRCWIFRAGTWTNWRAVRRVRYRDPVADLPGTAARTYQGTWVATFAPITGTDFVVVVQQR